MKTIHKAMLRSLFLLSAAFLLMGVTAVSAEPGIPAEVPVKGMVTMVDLGANSCVPCKMMAPILDKLRKEYEGRAAIVVIDVWKDKSQSKKYGIRSIPTQVFYDQEGKETYRHTGFLSENAIRTQLKLLGVQ